MIYTIHIPEEKTRIKFAAEVRKIIKKSSTYTPEKSNGLYQSDIGIQAGIDLQELEQIEALIERRGYSCTKRGSLHE